MFSKLKQQAIFLLAFLLYHIRIKLLFMEREVFCDVADPIPFDQAEKSGIISERINIDYSEQIHKDRTQIAPMIYLISSLKSRVPKTTEARGFEQRSAPHFATVDGAVDPAVAPGEMIDVVLDPNNYKYIQVNDILEFAFTPSSASYTNYGRVFSKPETDTVRVEPNDPALILSTSAVVGVADDTVIWIHGNSFGQFDESVEPITVLPNVIRNVTQIIRTPYALSRSAAKENMYGETERNRLMEIARFNHLIALEKTLLFNGPMVIIKQSTENAMHRGTMRGMFDWILKDSPKVLEYDGTRAFIDDHDEWVNDLFDPMLIDGAQYKRFILCNRGYKMFWNKASVNHPATKIYEYDKYGISGVKRVETGIGDLDLMVHPLINMRYTNTEEPMAMALHLKYLEHLPFLKTMLKANIQNPSADGVKDEFITEFSWLGYLPELHGLIRKAA